MVNWSNNVFWIPRSIIERRREITSPVLAIIAYQYFTKMATSKPRWAGPKQAENHLLTQEVANDQAVATNKNPVTEILPPGAS
jgi:hypothetical protein